MMRVPTATIRLRTIRCRRDHRRGPDSGALIADGGLAALECAAEQRIPAGDHLLVIGRVTGVSYVTDAGEPLIRFRRHYLPARL